MPQGFEGNDHASTIDQYQKQGHVNKNLGGRALSVPEETTETGCRVVNFQAPQDTVSACLPTSHRSSISHSLQWLRQHI
jgi:hypothetical protein